MPTLTQLSQQPNAIEQAIDAKHEALTRRINSAEAVLWDLLSVYLVDHLVFGDTGIKNVAENFLLLSAIDKVFGIWRDESYNKVLNEYANGVLSVTEEVTPMYADFAKPGVLKQIASDNEILLSALGIDAKGNAIKGGMLYELSEASALRQELKNVVIQGIRSGQTLQKFSRSIRDFVKGTKEDTGRLEKYWRTYAYDTYNQAVEVKNEQFRSELDLQWFIYTGDIIKDSRQFCIHKARHVFAVIEADTEWPNDPDLPGKKSGIPYTPRIDRGRWNCRHRIRYISEELAVQLDQTKVEAIKQKYQI